MSRKLREAKTYYLRFHKQFKNLDNPAKFQFATVSVADFTLGSNFTHVLTT